MCDCDCICDSVWVGLSSVLTRFSVQVIVFFLFSQKSRKLVNILKIVLHLQHAVKAISQHKLCTSLCCI